MNTTFEYPRRQWASPPGAIAAIVGGGPRVAAWKLWLAASMTGIVAFLLLPVGTLLQAGVFTLVQVGAAAVAATAVIRSSLRDRWIWVLLAGGMALNVAGDATWYLMPVVNHTQPTFPSVSDAAFLGANTAWLVATAIIIKRRSRGRLVVTFLDALIVASSLGALSYAFLIDPAVRSGGNSALTLAVAIAYPLLDIALVAAAACLMTFKEGRSPIVWLLVLGVGSQLLADSLFTGFTLAGAFLLGHWLMAVWMLAYAFVGAAILHPGRKSISSPPVEGEVPDLHTGRIVGLWAVALVVPGVLLEQAFHRQPRDQRRDRIRRVSCPHLRPDPRPAGRGRAGASAIRSDQP